jgi:hypothetical protein
MITEDYVSFETAKLLKEKGFDELTSLSYRLLDGFPQRITCRNSFEEGLVSRVTLQMAMKWLREVHHYYIQVMLDSWAFGDHCGYYVVLQKTDDPWEIMLSDVCDEVFYETPEEACEAGIRYCLENRI